MRIILLSILLLCAVSSSFAQRIPSDCTAPDSVVQKYKDDAARIVLRQILYTSSPYKDSVHIPKDMKDSVLRALLAVYNLTNSAEHDTVIMLLDIHTKLSPDIDFFYIRVDTSYKWAKNLIQQKLPTGNRIVDSLMEKYGMFIDKVKEDRRGVDFNFIERLNLGPLENIWRNIPGVSVALVDYFLCTPDIFEQRHDTSITLTYYYGWDRSDEFCKHKRSWHFTVFPDCSVQFDTVYGEHLELMTVASAISTTNNLFFYPNPASDKLTVELPAKSTLDIVDVEGKILLSTLCQQGNTEISVSTLPKGMYFLRAMDKNGSVRSAKFIKE